jgi:hypothetical protein
MVKITLKTLKQVKTGKVTYKTVEETVTEVTAQQHRQATSAETVKFFKRLGGSEHITRAYTCGGYLPVKVISTSPDRESRTVREYTFTWVD